MSSSPNPTEPGWYDDPDGRRGLERHWDGEKWGGAPRQRPPKLTWSGITIIVVGTIVLSAAAWLAIWYWL